MGGEEVAIVKVAHSFVSDHSAVYCILDTTLRGILHQCNMQYAILQKNIALQYST